MIDDVLILRFQIPEISPDAIGVNQAVFDTIPRTMRSFSSK